MKLIYVSNTSETTKKAHGLQIAKMCEALADLGIKVELVLPDREDLGRGNLFEFYNIKRNFNLVKLPICKKFIGFKFGFWLSEISFGLSLRKYLKSQKQPIIYTRDPLSIIFLRKYRDKLFFEAHKGPTNFLYRLVYKYTKGVVAITKNLGGELKNYQKNILIEPDGVDVKEFDINISKLDARDKLGLSGDKKIVLYAGNLKLGWKGVENILSAAKFLPEMLFVLLGIGTKPEYGANNILVFEYRPHQEIPIWLKAADVLLLPNSSSTKLSRLYTSPLKMFEYMASKRPIVASDLPSIREILNENNAILVKPDSPIALVSGIKCLIDNENIDAISQKALDDVRKYSWHNRASRIWKFLNS